MIGAGGGTEDAFFLIVPDEISCWIIGDWDYAVAVRAAFKKWNGVGVFESGRHAIVFSGTIDAAEKFWSAFTVLTLTGGDGKVSSALETLPSLIGYPVSFQMDNGLVFTKTIEGAIASFLKFIVGNTGILFHDDSALNAFKRRRSGFLGNSLRSYMNLGLKFRLRVLIIGFEGLKTVAGTETTLPEAVSVFIAFAMDDFSALFACEL